MDISQCNAFLYRDGNRHCLYQEPWPGLLFLQQIVQLLVPFWQRYKFEFVLKKRGGRGMRTLLPTLSFKVTFSPTVVVARSGPGLLPFSCPNFAHFCLSATA